MNLSIGNKTLAITGCTRRRDTRRGFFLDIEIPKENIGMDELYALFDGCTENIVVIDDEGTENVYTGFKTIGSFSLENGVYKVAQVCTSEYEAQLSIAQNRIAEQTNVIAAQAEMIGLLEEATVEQIATIDSLLLDVIPVVIADAVTAAVQDALGSNSDTETGEIETETEVSEQE